MGKIVVIVVSDPRHLAQKAPIEGRYYEQGTRPASHRIITAFHIGA